MELIVATRNAHKTREIGQILGSTSTVRDLTAHPEISEIVESGTSFEENAKLKAIAVSRELPGLVIAEDSGLEVDALGGAPGVRSARYAGENACDTDRMAKLLTQLAKVDQGDQRRARFRCVVALARDGQVLATFEGVVEGKIAERPRGSHGFGYDPVFIPNEFEKTLAEVPEEVKNSISHRAQAIRKLQAELPTLCGEAYGFGAGGGGGAPGARAP
jgi:XTP/dITP diphosphohydrolase